MLRPSKGLQDLVIADRDDATHDAIGDVKDLFFDDEAWAIRYHVVETGSLPSSRKVPMSPIAAVKPDWTAKRLPVSLTREQIKNSPDIDTDMPVTRRHETDCFYCCSYPCCWGGTGLLWGRSGNPMLLPPGDARYGSAPATRAEADEAQARTEARQRDQDPHPRSCPAVVGYAIEASDGQIGHVQGLLVHEDSGAIRYLVVSAGNWCIGHEALKQAPWYDPASPLSREMEVAVFSRAV